MKDNKNKSKVDTLYKVCRIEFNKMIELCSSNFEDIDNFKIIAKNSNYRIFLNDEDITNKYK